ncbi:MAG: class I SAM-dependent methyltransferase [Alphaproteobacteria bacterium]|nr:class I SAM-dependent methyltransferase [Alphaproteobacteria bacterium]
MRDYTRFDNFLNSLVGDVYPEVTSEISRSITGSTIDTLLRDGLIAPGQSVLDVGCGQGPALELFEKIGMRAVGITMGTDYDVCVSKGFNVRSMDQNFMDFDDAEFDVLWCRHVLEHSIAPLFTLSEYSRVVKPGGIVYIEVPAPDTSAHHEINPNHYSVLPLPVWMSLFPRVGLIPERVWSIGVALTIGPDTYHSFVLRRRG